MSALSFWSIGHFVLWAFVGRFLSKDWTQFFVASVGWEVIEMHIPLEMAHEMPDNIVMDIVFNILGFYFGLYMRAR